ncbi:MAG: small multi-drug export protein [Rubrobacteraceae bacterium]
MLDLLLKLFTAAALGAVDLWLGIPAGLVAGLPPTVSGIAAVSGAVVGVVLVSWAGKWLRGWVYNRRWLDRRRVRIERMWKRYGVIGVALQAPMLTGAPLATVLALALGAPTRPLLFWMISSVVLWVAVLTGATVLGFEIFDR